jgi:hypothetical protein
VHQGKVGRVEKVYTLEALGNRGWKFAVLIEQPQCDQQGLALVQFSIVKECLKKLSVGSAAGIVKRGLVVEILKTQIGALGNQILGCFCKLSGEFGRVNDQSLFKLS